MNCNKETLIRTVFLMIALLNQVLTAIGKNPLPFSEEGIYEGVSAVVAAAASLWSWWKNNSFTAAAAKADAYLKQLKSGGTAHD